MTRARLLLFSGVVFAIATAFTMLVATGAAAPFRPTAYLAAPPLAMAVMPGQPAPSALPTLAASSSAAQIIRLLDWYEDRANSVSFSPDSHWLAVGSSLGFYVYDARSLALLRFIPNAEWVRSVAFSPDGASLVSASYDTTIKLWRVSDGTLLQTLRGHSDRVRSVAFSPDGLTLVSASDDDTVRFWRVSDGTALRTIGTETAGVRSVALSPDGRWLAAGTKDGTVNIRHMPDGTLARALKGHTAWVRGVAFSPDSTLLASVGFDMTVRLWRVSTGELLHTLTGHTTSVLDVVFSPDGQTLVSASEDTSLRLWRVSDGAPLRILKGHTGFVFAAAFSPDGSTLASASADGTVRLWPVDELKATSIEQDGPPPVVAEDCRHCHHPRNDFQAAIVPDVKCQTCHADGASLFWDPDMARDPDPHAALRTPGAH
jgi:WD40 repeat protein